MGIKATISYAECVEKCIEHLTVLIGKEAATVECNAGTSVCEHFGTKWGHDRSIQVPHSDPFAPELQTTYNYQINGLMLEGSGCSPIFGQEILNFQYVTGGTNHSITPPLGDITAISASVPPLTFCVGSFGGAATNHFYLPNSTCTGSRKTIVYFKGDGSSPLSCSLTLSGSTPASGLPGGMMVIPKAGQARELVWTGEYWVSMSCCPPYGGSRQEN